jgi:hypothetical protein
MGLNHPALGDISFQQAAADWYTEVYQPIVAAIGRRNLLQQLADTTAADLYVWVSGRIMEAAEQDGERLSPDAVVAALDDQRASAWSRAVRDVMHVLNEIGDALVGPQAGIPEWAEQTLEWGDFQPPPRYQTQITEQCNE